MVLLLLLPLLLRALAPLLAAVLSVDLLKASPSKAAATLEMEAVPLLAERAAHGDVEGGGGSAIHR